MKARFVCSTLILLTTLFLAACSDDSDEDPTPTQPPPATVAGATETPPPNPAPPTATPPPPTPTATLPPAEPIVWSDCGGTGFDCAEYEVPLDYDDPDGDTITLAVRRLPASNADERLGVLFANPGGPGGSTINLMSGWARGLPSELREQFDVVLFDPRGVGLSSPLVCHSNIQELLGLEPYPETDEDWDGIEEATREHTSECAEAGGELLQHMGTRDVARDMDRLREAMGEAQINYFGYSYGTVIGQVYADLFPQNVRAMVLDGAVDVSLPRDQQALEQTLGFEAAFQRYVANCAERSCLPGDPAAAIRDLIARAGESPIPSLSGDRPLGAGEALYGVIGALYSPATWVLLTGGVNAALEGDGSGLLFLVDTFGRNPDGSYSNQTEANSAVNCLDYETDRDPMHHRQLAEDFAEQAPMFGPATGQLGLYCAFWEADPEPLEAPRAGGAPPIVVIGTTGDPATPYKWAVALARQLESGVLLTYDGEGHTAYLHGNGCINDAVNTYLVDLESPPQGTVCGDAGIEPAPPVP